MHAEEDFDPLALPALAPVISMPRKPVSEQEPLPPEPPEYEPPLAPPRAAPLGRTLPHSLDAEEFVLSCCMIDDSADVLQKCFDAQLSAASFYDHRHAIVFDCILHLHRTGAPTEAANVAEELKRTGQLDIIGGFPFLAQVSSRIPTTAQAVYFIKTVRDLALRREIIRVGTSVVEDAYRTADTLEVAAKCEERLVEVLRRGQQVTDLAPMPHASLTYPTSDDPNILLGQDDYLGRGGGLLFISHGGAGKSSFIYGACSNWALGRPFAGIRSNGPLRTLMIQAEDSERYIGKLRTSYDFTNKLTAEQSAQRDGNVIIYHARGLTGAPFFALLRRAVEKHAPDLVVINPVYLYAEGDISSPDACQPFLVGLDAVNRDQRFAYILVHHTGKPAKKDNRNQRVDLEDWETIYMGFGSSFFANWPRCTMLLEPRGTTRGHYWLRLGKAGMNAGVTKAVEQGGSKRHEPTTKIALQYSTETMTIGTVKRPVIHWEVDEEATAADEPKKSGRSKREDPKFRPEEVLGIFPLEKEEAQSLSVISREAKHRFGVKEAEMLRLRNHFATIGAIASNGSGLYYRASVAT